MLIFIVGGGYYYCSNVSGNVLTLQNLGISGSNVVSSTVIAAGAIVTAKLDLLNYGTNTVIGNTGLYDYATSFYPPLASPFSTGTINNYNIGGTGGNIGAFTGLTGLTMHVLVYQNAYYVTTGSTGVTTTAESQIFGYSWK